MSAVSSQWRVAGSIRLVPIIVQKILMAMKRVSKLTPHEHSFDLRPSSEMLTRDLLPEVIDTSG